MNREAIFFLLFLKKKVTIRDFKILSWFDIRLIKALRSPRGANGLRSPV